MANSNENKMKAIVLTQNWGAGKIAIGTEYKLKDLDRTLKLVECEGYPHGKFIFDNGEEFNIGKYFDSFFIEKEKESEQVHPTIYDEEVWDKVDNKLNADEKSIIRKTLGTVQANKAFHEMSYYDVTDIIDSIIKNQSNNPKEMDLDIVKKIYGYLIYNNFPFFTKERLYVLFSNCDFQKTKKSDIVRVIKNNRDVGYLVSSEGKYIFAPKNKDLNDEYKFANDSSTGFFYTAENYLDIVLSTIDRYKDEFVPVYNTKLGKNNESFGYQADSSIKTLLAFSCECYLKSLLINSGKDISNIKELGHGLSVLFTALNDDQISKVFNYMKSHGYNLIDIMYHDEYETNNLTEKFMLDLARVDDAFIDARYSAEKDKNTDYGFLYKFALALRHCSKKEYMISSPFDQSIESKIGRK